MYNPITAIRDLYHKLVGRKEKSRRESGESKLAQAIKDFDKILSERNGLRAYASTYRCRFVNNPGFF